MREFRIRGAVFLSPSSAAANPTAEAEAPGEEPSLPDGVWRRRTLRWGAALLLVGAAAWPGSALFAQQGDGEPDSQRSSKTAQVARWAGDGIRVDGMLEDAAWRDAVVVSDFVQKEPQEGAAPTLPTRVRFVIDGDALYVGAEMESPGGELRAPVGRRDDDGQAEYLIVSLDTYLDGRTAYAFGVTAGGTRLDRYHGSDSEQSYDSGFDPVWQARTRRTESGWTAEMRIPLSQLRFNPGAEQRWGLNLTRFIPSREELVYWVPVGRNETGWSSRFGMLEGLGRVQASRGIELLPYVATGASFLPDPDPANPFAESREETVRAGADIKVGLGPNLTLDATVNPDFGQVEADPAEVNLSVFETFFSERRPFFTEGSRLINRSGMFYSRRIGGLPSVPVGGDFVDVPDEATILGAAKLTGRLPSGTSIGVLSAVTDEESARVFDVDNSAITRQRIAPRTYTGVATLEQEFGPDASTVGFQAVGLHRGMADDDPLRTYLHDSSIGGRVDWNFRFQGGAYTLFGAVEGSHVRGDSLALLRTQRSSVHYFQRPDQDHVSVDPSATSMSGMSAFMGFDKNAGSWLWDLFVTTETPGLERNDAGRLGDTGEYGAFGSLTYRQTTPGSWYRRYSIRLGQENLWTYAWDRQFGAIRSDINVVLPNFWNIDLTAWRDFESISKTLTRGGPLAGNGAAWTVIARLANSSASDTRWNARIYHGEDEQGGRTQRLSGGLSMRPSPRVQLSVNPNYLRVTNPRQYGGRLAGGPALTFGQRYVFSFIERSTFLAQIRAAYALRPDLTLELYAEPFAASGRYHRFGELPAPRSQDLRFYGTDGTTIQTQPDGSVWVTDGEEEFTIPFRDFNVRSFRSNAVVRWEWRPGSTLFLVWQQNRFSALADGALVGVSDLWDTLDAPGENRFIIKASYWLPVG